MGPGTFFNQKNLQECISIFYFYRDDYSLFFFPLILTWSATMFSLSPLFFSPLPRINLGRNSWGYVPFSVLFHWVSSIFFNLTFESTTKLTLSFSSLGPEISCCQVLFIERKFMKKKMKSFYCHLVSILSSSFEEGDEDTTKHLVV